MRLSPLTLEAGTRLGVLHQVEILTDERLSPSKCTVLAVLQMTQQLSLK